MSDSRISAFINTFLPASNSGNVSRVEVVSIPADLPQGVVKGEVTANKDGQVTIKTDQGPVILQTDLNVQVGEKVNIRLQNIIQNANAQLLADLSVVADPKTRQTQPQAAQQAAPNIPPRAVELSSLAQQFDALETAYPDVLKMPVQEMAAKTLALPQSMTDQDLENLIRTVLKLTPGQVLPQTVKEGLDKLKLMLPMLNNNLQLPAAPVRGISSPALIPLLQMFQPGQSAAAVQNALQQANVHPLFLLQQITPGQKLTPDILNLIRDQIMIMGQKAAEATAANMPAAPIDLADDGKPNPLQMLNSLVSKVKTNIPFLQGQQTSVPVYQPLMGLVLGESGAVPLDGKIPVLMFLMTASGQNILSFSTIENSKPGDLPLLPGSVILAAVNQKSQMVALPSSSELTAFSSGVITPLHVALGDDWPALEEMWGEVLAQHAAHPDALAAMRASLPAPVAQQMPAAALLFFAVLKNGFFGDWNGQALLDKLPINGKAALIAQLGRDMQAIQNAMSDNGPVDAWRPLPMPLNVNDQLMRLQWFFRHQYDTPADRNLPEEERRSKRRTRFVVDVPKTKFGDLQIDGLVQQKTLEVILRTENDLKGDMQNAIRERYQNALETSGFGGGLIFQAGRQHYVHA